MLRFAAAFLVLLTVPVLAQNLQAVNTPLTSCTQGKPLYYNGTQLVCPGGAPTVVGCGTSPTVTGTILQGTISAGTGNTVVNTCGLNFGSSLSPVAGLSCVATGSLSPVSINTITSQGLSFTAAMTGATIAKIYYSCSNAF